MVSLKKETLYRNRQYICTVALYLLILLGSYRFLQNYEGYRALKAYFLFVFPATILGTVLLVKAWAKPVKELFTKEKRSCAVLLGILAVQVIVFLPMLVQPYLFMDELWCFQGQDKWNILQFLPLGRPLAFFLQALYNGICWTNSNYGRLISACAAILLVVLIFVWVYKCTKSLLFSSVLALLTGATSSMVDIVSFLAAFPMLWGLLFSSLSVFFFLEAVKAFPVKKSTACLWVAVSYCSLVLGFNCYAISTPIVFFLWGIYALKQQEWKDLITSLTIYAGVFLLGAVTYLMSINFFCDRYDIVGQVTARGSLTHELVFYVEKLQWFVTEVLPQGIYRIYDALSFGTLTTRNNLFFATEVGSGMGWILCGAYYVFVLIGLFLLLWKRRDGALIFVLEILFTIASFFPFLILPESNYMSYYGFPCFCMCCLLLIAALCGYYRQISQKINLSVRFRRTAVVVLALLLALEYNTYSSTAWVQYNNIPFTVAKTEMLNQRDVLDRTRVIYVLGAAAPVQLDSFSIHTIRQVLYDLGEDPDRYHITCTLNGSYSTGVLDNIFEDAYSKATQEERALLDRCYTRDLYYGIYWSNDELITAEDSQALKDFFTRTGIIPSKEDAVWVDLRALNLWRML